MKKLLFLLTFFVLHAHSQTLKYFKVGGGLLRCWGYYYIPDSLDINGTTVATSSYTGKIPVMAFFHGLGERGSTSTDAAKLLINGPFAYAANVKQRQFAILAIQGQNYSAYSWAKYVIWNDSLFKNIADTNRICWTGLSSGGDQTCQAIQAGYHGWFAPMSPAGGVFHYDTTKKYNIWTFCNRPDGGSIYVANAMQLDTQLHADSTWGVGGHCCWNPYYGMSYKDPLYNRSLYDWWLGSAPLPPAPMTTKFPIIIGKWGMKDDTTFVLYIQDTTLFKIIIK